RTGGGCARRPAARWTRTRSCSGGRSSGPGPGRCHRRSSDGSPRLSQPPRRVGAMDIVLLLVGVVAGLVAGVAGAWVVVVQLGGARRPPDPHLAARHEATLRAAVDAAVDTVVKVAGERL